MRSDDNRTNTFLAFDFGRRRVGVAIGNSVSNDSRPLDTLTYRSYDELFSQIKRLIDEWQPDHLIVGRPLTAEGGSQPVTVLAERFSNRLTGRFGLPVTLVDERYSSSEARTEKRDSGQNDPGRRERPCNTDDALAAAIILRQYLNE